MGIFREGILLKAWGFYINHFLSLFPGRQCNLSKLYFKHIFHIFYLSTFFSGSCVETST